MGTSFGGPTWNFHRFSKGDRVARRRHWQPFLHSFSKKVSIMMHRAAGHNCAFMRDCA